MAMTSMTMARFAVSHRKRPTEVLRRQRWRTKHQRSAELALNQPHDKDRGFENVLHRSWKRRWLVMQQNVNMQIIK